MTLVAPYDSVRALWEAANIPHLGASLDPAARRLQPTDESATGKKVYGRQPCKWHAESRRVPTFVPQPGPGSVTAATHGLSLFPCLFFFVLPKQPCAERWAYHGVSRSCPNMPSIGLPNNLGLGGYRNKKQGRFVALGGTGTNMGFW
ncbi:hypothetical protein CGRA01v4_12281 [Colletotrichum graminicola]|nr:hypothetical protein CGRA01v4_12281 [Colletotrichum graminicola]